MYIDVSWHFHDSTWIFHWNNCVIFSKTKHVGDIAFHDISFRTFRNTKPHILLYTHTYSKYRYTYKYTHITYIDTCWTCIIIFIHMINMYTYQWYLYFPKIFHAQKDEALEILSWAWQRCAAVPTTAWVPGHPFESSKFGPKMFDSKKMIQKKFDPRWRQPSLKLASCVFQALCFNEMSRFSRAENGFLLRTWPPAQRWRHLDVLWKPSWFWEMNFTKVSSKYRSILNDITVYRI